MKKIISLFKEIYKNVECNIVKSPLRICPLGAHVDHQHGLVTGLALDASINLVYSRNDDGYIRVQSIDFPDEEYFHVDDVLRMIPGFWGNYLRGAVLSLKQNNKLKYGINGMISGKLPIGGLSSSAAVITAYLLALCDVNDIQTTKEELIQYSHWVETNFIGLKNGILDQSANILSKKNHLMFMDCKTNKYELVEKSINMSEFEVVVVYSGVSKALIGTDYNNRVDECKVAAWMLQELTEGKVSNFKDVKLRDIIEEKYNLYKDKLIGRFQRRAEHFFSENKRVIQGVEAWKNGDLKTFGRLMFESGESSIYNYESGCPELITIYNLLRQAPGVYGARFSGAGYRGCCIGLVNPNYKEEITSIINSEYPKIHPKYKDVFKVNFCKIDDGARIVEDF